MKMKYIKVRGAIGFKKGLGVDEVEFDLSDKTGLVALSGPNGRGKTTLLEMMMAGLFRILPSRKKSLAHHFFLRDSIIELKFTYNGDEWHTILKIDAGSDNGRQEGFIVVNGDSKVDSKVTVFDEYVRDNYGTVNLFYNSIFCAQGSGNMSDMRTGEIKELFVEFLRIERLAEYEKTAKAGAAFFQKKLDILSGQIEVCEESLKAFESTEAEIKQTDIKIKSKQFDIEENEKSFKLIENNISVLKKTILQQAEDIKRRAEIETRLKKLITDRDAISAKVKSEGGNYLIKKIEIEAEIESLDTVLADKEKIFAAAARIANLSEWEKYFLNCFECTMDEQAELDREMKTSDASKETIEKQINALEDDLILDGLKTTLDCLGKRKFDFDSNGSILQSKLKSAQNDFSLMQAAQNVLACKEKIAIAIDPDCVSTICPALEMVAEAKIKLPALEKIEQDAKKKVDENIKEIEASLKICKANLVDIDSKTRHCLMDYDGVSKKITSDIINLTKKLEIFKADKKQTVVDYFTISGFKTFYKERLNFTRERIRQLVKFSEQKSMIEISEEKRKSFLEKLSNLTSSFDIRDKELSKQFDVLAGDILTNEKSISLIDGNINLTLDIQIKAEYELKAETVLWQEELSGDLETLKESAAVLKNNLLEKVKLSDSLNEKNLSATSIKKEISEWTYLKLACSKTGLQALEIDGAAPLIVSEANSLLEKAFGLDSQIKIITQDPETGREVFQIKVIREDGAEDDFSNLSGGQKVWIAKALSLGMTLVSKNKSGRKFQTLFADEEDGALDNEKALEFVQLYRSMMATGDFETCFFISHNPDVVTMADHEIKF